MSPAVAALLVLAILAAGVGGAALILHLGAMRRRLPSPRAGRGDHREAMVGGAGQPWWEGRRPSDDVVEFDPEPRPAHWPPARDASRYPDLRSHRRSLS